MVGEASSGCDYSFRMEHGLRRKRRMHGEMSHGRRRTFIADAVLTIHDSTTTPVGTSGFGSRLNTEAAERHLPPITVFTIDAAARTNMGSLVMMIVNISAHGISTEPEDVANGLVPLLVTREAMNCRIMMRMFVDDVARAVDMTTMVEKPSASNGRPITDSEYLMKETGGDGPTTMNLKGSGIRQNTNVNYFVIGRMATERPAAAVDQRGEKFEDVTNNAEPMLMKWGTMNGTVMTGTVIIDEAQKVGAATVFKMICMPTIRDLMGRGVHVGNETRDTEREGKAGGRVAAACSPLVAGTGGNIVYTERMSMKLGAAQFTRMIWTTRSGEEMIDFATTMLEAHTAIGAGLEAEAACLGKETGRLSATPAVPRSICQTEEVGSIGTVAVDGKVAFKESVTSGSLLHKDSEGDMHVNWKGHRLGDIGRWKVRIHRVELPSQAKIMK